MLRLLPMRSCLPRRLIQTATTGVSKGGVKLTLFSKPQCGLCEEAKEIIEDVLESDAIPKHNISMNIVNINQLNNKNGGICIASTYLFCILKKTMTKRVYLR